MRVKARELIKSRSYDAATTGKRVQSWKTVNSSANSEIAKGLVTIRNRVRDLRRNNPYAAKIIQGISTNIVGTGFIPGCDDENLLDLFNKLANSTKCDANGHLNFYGIQKLVVESMVESGECLIVRQYDTSLEIPLRLRVLEADFLDHTKDDIAKNLIQGVQYDSKGDVSGYWIFPSHPSDTSSQSAFVKAADVIHLFRQDRPGQVRGMSWLAPVVIPLKKLSDYEDATLEKALISNLFVGFVYDPTSAGSETENPQIELQPGAMVTLPPGKQIEFAEPPNPSAPSEYLNHQLRAIATGTGFPYELLSGNLSEVNFSTARLSFNEFARLLDDWRYNLLVPTLLDKVWNWFYEAVTISGLYRSEIMPSCTWTPPLRIMMDLFREVPAITQMIRAGLITPSEAVRQQGYDPKSFWIEYAKDLATLDALGIVLESDPRKDAERKTAIQPEQQGSQK